MSSGRRDSGTWRVWQPEGASSRSADDDTARAVPSRVAGMGGVGGGGGEGECDGECAQEGGDAADHGGAPRRVGGPTMLDVDDGTVRPGEVCLCRDGAR